MEKVLSAQSSEAPKPPAAPTALSKLLEGLDRDKVYTARVYFIEKLPPTR